MAHAYTPGLKVTPFTVYSRERRLPLRGAVIVKVGQKVLAEEVVARTELPGTVFPVNAAHKLSCPPKDVPKSMLVEEGTIVDEGQVIGRYSGFFGLFPHELKAPVTGTVESISRMTGQVMFRAAPIPVKLSAFIDGTIIEIYEGEGVRVETPATFIQGIFGIGGEVQGTIKIVASHPGKALDEGDLPPDITGKVLVAGSLVTLGSIRKAIEQKASAIIVGGMHDQDLMKLLGYDLGLAITGNETLGIVIVLTEGFGTIPMAHRTYELLKSREGSRASVCGATQIRAGVMRPEIVIPLQGEIKTVQGVVTAGQLEIGASVRIIRKPNFGEIARVVGLPVNLAVIETGASVRVVDLELTTGEKTTIPRANIELLEG